MKNQNLLGKKKAPTVVVSSDLLGHGFKVSGDMSKEFKECMASLKSVPKLFKLVRNNALRVLRRSAKPVRFKSRTTKGTGVAITIEPSDGLLRFCAAIRTFKLNLLAVEHSAHNFNGGRWPNDPKLSHGHWRPGFDCNLDSQSS